MKNTILYDGSKFKRCDECNDTTGQLFILPRGSCKFSSLHCVALDPMVGDYQQDVQPRPPIVALAMA